MIADGHVLIVWQERIIGTKLSANIGRVMDANIEIGIVANLSGDMHLNRVQPVEVRHYLCPVALMGQELSLHGLRGVPDESGTELRVVRAAALTERRRSLRLVKGSMSA